MPVLALKAEVREAMGIGVWERGVEAERRRMEEGHKRHERRRQAAAGNIAEFISAPGSNKSERLMEAEIL